MKAVTVIAALAALIVCMDAAVQPAEASLVHWTMPRLTNRPFLGMQWRDPFEEFNRMWNNVIAEQQRVWSCQKHCSAVAARALSSSVTVTESDLPSGETALVHTFPGVRAADVSVEVTGDRLSVRASRPLATASPTAARDAECGCPVESASTATSITTVTSNGLCRTRTVSTAPGTTPVETVERVYTLPRYTASDAVTASLTEHATTDGADVASELTIHIPKAVLPQAKAVPIAVTKTVAPPAPKPAIAAAPEAAASPAPVPTAAPAAASSAPASAPAPAPATAAAPKAAAAAESDIIDLDRN